MSRLLLVLALPVLLLIAVVLAVLSLYEAGSQTGERLEGVAAAPSSSAVQETPLRMLRRVETFVPSRAA